VAEPSARHAVLRERHLLPDEYRRRPLNSWPAFIPVTFELNDLFAAGLREYSGHAGVEWFASPIIHCLATMGFGAPDDGWGSSLHWSPKTKQFDPKRPMRSSSSFDQRGVRRCSIRWTSSWRSRFYSFCFLPTGHGNEGKNPYRWSPARFFKDGAPLRPNRKGTVAQGQAARQYSHSIRACQGRGVSPTCVV